MKNDSFNGQFIELRYTHEDISVAVHLDHKIHQSQHSLKSSFLNLKVLTESQQHFLTVDYNLRYCFFPVQVILLLPFHSVDSSFLISWISLIVKSRDLEK